MVNICISSGLAHIMGIRLRQQDIKLLEFLADDFLVLSRRQIQELIPRKERRTLQRLAILIKEGYICKTDPVVDFSGRLVFYYIGDRAAEALERERGSVVDRKRQARQLADGQSKHTYLLNWIHIRFLKGLGEYPDLELTEWISHDHAYWEGRGYRGLQPDAYMEFVRNKERFSYFVEVDRGTEKGKSIRQKIGRYERYRRSKRVEAGGCTRILFITEKAARAKALLTLFPSDAFLAATAEEVRRRPLFDAYWRANGGEMVALSTPYGSGVASRDTPPSSPDISLTSVAGKPSLASLPPIPDPPSPPVLPTTIRRSTGETREGGQRSYRVAVVGRIFVCLTLFVVGILIALAYRLSCL